jgi:hypothetical protein
MPRNLYLIKTDMFRTTTVKHSLLPQHEAEMAARLDSSSAEVVEAANTTARAGSNLGAARALLNQVRPSCQWRCMRTEAPAVAAPELSLDAKKTVPDETDIFRTATFKHPLLPQHEADMAARADSSSKEVMEGPNSTARAGSNLSAARELLLNKVRPSCL